MQQAVTCPKCGSPNALGQRFCWNCGTTLASSCPNCSAPMDPGSRFCGNCGAQLPPQQAGGWGQQGPQTGWGQQQPPPYQQADAWGQPPPQQQAGWGQQQPPPPYQQAGAQPGAWGQEMPKKGVGGLVLLLVVLLIFLGGFGYFAFISKDKPWGSSSSTTTTTSAITTGPFVFVKNIDNTASKASMEIQFETNDVYKGQIEYGIDTKYGSTSQVEADYVKTHTAALADLKLSTSYHYRIVLKNKSNVEWKSDDMTFKTPNPSS